MNTASEDCSSGCDDDVRQDYYVYVHKDKATGVPFYVGKGVANRAYRREGRNQLWKQRVENLANGYEVEIAEDNLTEDEARDLEIDLILKHKRMDEGGTLVNKSPGDGVAFVIGFPILGGDGEYKNASYRVVTKEQKHEFAQGILARMRGFADSCGRVVDDTKDELAELEEVLVETIAEVQELAEKVRKRRATYKKFCWVLEQTLEALEYELEFPSAEDEDGEVLKTSWSRQRLPTGPRGIRQGRPAG
ncbi:MAG: hypothetical protein IH987_03180 [Planctomycetes bacterium]|nr:hypothetical protein [Planctomycetota bacterium]